MHHNKLKRLLSVLLTAVLLVSLFSITGSAAPGAAELNITEKLDRRLLSVLDGMAMDDTVNVSVWFQDIDYEKVAREVTARLQKKVSAGKLGKAVLELPNDDLKPIQQPASSSSFFSSAIDAVPQAVKNIDSKEAQEFIETKRAVSHQEYQAHNAQAADGLFAKDGQLLSHTSGQSMPRILYTSQYAPNVLMTMTKAQVYSAARAENVDAIDYLDEEVQGQPPAEPAAARASADTDTTFFDRTGITALKDMGYTGKNVKIGMLDKGIPNVNFSIFADIVADERLHIREKDINSAGDHASYTAGLLVGKKDGYTGAAPDAELYCVNAGADLPKTYEALEWLVAQGVSIINLSWDYPFKGTDNSYNGFSKWLDHISYNHAVTVVVSAGNGDTSSGSKICANRVGGFAMGYNVITAGNYDSYYEKTGTITAYNLLTTLPVKPDLVAPGYRLHTPLNLEGKGTDGTSCSAPIVAGAAAQLCQLYSYFKTKPVILKAALLAGAEKTQEMKNEDSDANRTNNVDSISGDWRIGLSRKSGAGMLNVQNAYTILKKSKYIYFPNFGVTNNPFQQEVDVTSTAKRLQICLCWPKKNTVSGADHSTGVIGDALKDTFYLEVLDPDGEPVYSSWYRNDTKEYIAFTPKTAGEYTIRVKKTSLPSEGADLALAWWQN